MRASTRGAGKGRAKPRAHETGKTLNPLLRLVGKQKVGAETAMQFEFTVLAALDAAKRGQATNGQSNVLALTLLTSVIVWAELGNQKRYDEAVIAWDALKKASERPTELLDLTTGEYRVLREAFGHYTAQLPHLEIKLFDGATKMADERMKLFNNNT